MSIGFSLLRSIIAFFLLEYFLSSGGIFFFLFFVFVGGVLCLYYFYETCLGFVYFGRVSLEFLWRAGSYFFCMGSAVWNAGPVQFIWALAWGGWRGSTGFLLIGSVVVSTVRYI